MVAQTSAGEWGNAKVLDLPQEWKSARKNMPQERIDAMADEIFTLAEQSQSVREIFDCLRRHMNGAQIAVRAPDENAEKGWSYQWVPDAAVQIVAARTMGDILRLFPKSNGVIVNNGPTQTLNITTTERLAELDGIGVPREEIAKACQDLLEASKGVAKADGATGGF